MVPCEGNRYDAWSSPCRTEYEGHGTFGIIFDRFRNPWMNPTYKNNESIRWRNSSRSRCARTSETGPSSKENFEIIVIGGMALVRWYSWCISECLWEWRFRQCPGDGLGFFPTERCESSPKVEKRAYVDLCISILNWWDETARGKSFANIMTLISESVASSVFASCRRYIRRRT